MSYTHRYSQQVHDRQVAGVSAVQSLLVRAVETMTGIRDLAPKMPERLSTTLGEVTAPLTKIVGTPGELQAHALASSREWLEVQHKFHTALLNAMSPSSVNGGSPKRTSASKI